MTKTDTPIAAPGWVRVARRAAGVVSTVRQGRHVTAARTGRCSTPGIEAIRQRPGGVWPGQALVETALSLSVVLALTVAIVEVVLYGHTWQLAVSAAQEGARVASAEGRTLTDGVRQARSLLDQGLGDRADRLTVNPTCTVVVADRCQAEAVAIQITGEAELPLVSGAPLRLPLDVTVSMLVEGR